MVKLAPLEYESRPDNGAAFYINKEEVLCKMTKREWGSSIPAIRFSEENQRIIEHCEELTFTALVVSACIAILFGVAAIFAELAMVYGNLSPIWVLVLGSISAAAFIVACISWRFYEAE